MMRVAAHLGQYSILDRINHRACIGAVVRTRSELLGGRSLHRFSLPVSSIGAALLKERTPTRQRLSALDYSELSTQSAKTQSEQGGLKALVQNEAA
jgi:hypothetical protein